MPDNINNNNINNNQCGCDACILFQENQYCALCNRDGAELEEIGEETLFYGNRELEREDLVCHHYFCQGCRFWMHRNGVRTCRVCRGDISEIIRSQLSCPYNCSSESESLESESDSEPENLT